MGATTIPRPVKHLKVLPLRTLSDERLAELAGVGHSEAFETLYERYRESLARYCRSIVRDPDDGKDALQNTMMSVLRAIQVRVPAGPIRPWIYRIAHNESISIIRRRHPHEELSVETPDRADTALASESRDRLDSLLLDLRSLPERQRGAIVMRELGGLEYAEIANALEMSAVSARKAVFEARVALHDLATGRDANCDEIRLRISNGDGRVLRARSIRGHLSACASCSSFEQGLHDRHVAFGLIPAFPMISAAALLGLALPGGGGGSTSGLALGGSAAGGSAIGGGSIAAVKGIALGSAIAVAGAGVFVGSGISSHVRHPHRVAQVVAHAQPARSARPRTITVAQVAKPARVIVASAPAPRVRTAALTETSATAYTTPGITRTVVSKPNTPGPTIAPPVTAAAPTSAAPKPPVTPPSSTSSPTTTASAPPTTPPGDASATTTAPARPTATSLVASVIQSALQTAGAEFASAEAQAGQALSLAGAAQGTATKTFQGILGAIFHGGNG